MDSGLSPGVVPQNHGRTMILWVSKQRRVRLSTCLHSHQEEVHDEKFQPCKESAVKTPQSGKESCNAGDTGEMLV